MSSRALPLLALLLSAGIFFAYVKPTWQGPIAETKAAIAGNDAALKAAAEYHAKEKSLLREKAAIDPANIARLSSFLPDSVDNVGIILDLNALAASSSLALMSIDVTAKEDDSTGQRPVAVAGAAAPQAGPGVPGAGAGATGTGTLPSPSRSNPLGSVDLSLSVVGTYTAFQAFLASIERSARLLDIKDLTIKGSDTGVYSYEMELRLYWLR